MTWLSWMIEAYVSIDLQSVGLEPDEFCDY